MLNKNNKILQTTDSCELFKIRKNGKFSLLLGKFGKKNSEIIKCSKYIKK